MLQYFSRQNIVPDGRGNTDKQKRRYLGFRGSVGEGRRARGSEPRSSLLGAGSHCFRARNGSPWERPLCGTGSATPAGPSPRPSPFLRTPQSGRSAVPLRLLPAAHAQLFVCCWSFSLFRKKEIGWRMGRRKRGALGEKCCTFAAVDSGREGLIFC